jgi:Tfp pilus assembly protein PilO
MKDLIANSSNNWVKTIGVYIIIILALLRFLIYPLHAAVKNRRAVYADQQETYLLKSRLLQQARRTRDAGDVVKDRDKVRFALYPRDARFSDIQAEMLTVITKYAEKDDVNVLGFEMPEVINSEKISEVPVVIRLSGNAESFVKFLKSIQENKKIFAVKVMDISESGEGMTFLVTVNAFRMEV